MSQAQESIEYINNLCSTGDPDQLVPVSHLKRVLTEISRLENHIDTQAELLSIYRTQLAKV